MGLMKNIAGFMGYGGNDYNQYLQREKNAPFKRVINAAERNYFNIPGLVKGATKAAYGDMNSVDSASADKRASRGALMAQEARLNALREQARGLGMNNFEGDFDKKNLSNPNNVTGAGDIGNIYNLDAPFIDEMRRLQAKRENNDISAGKMIELDKMRRAWNQLNRGQAPAQGAALQYKKDLEAAQADLPGMLNSNYLAAAKRAGTFGDTAEFNAGLQDEVQHGLVGANAVIQQDLDQITNASATNPYAEPWKDFKGKERREARKTALAGRSKWGYRLGLPTNGSAVAPGGKGQGAVGTGGIEDLAAPTAKTPTGGVTPTMEPTAGYQPRATDQAAQSTQPTAATKPADADVPTTPAEEPTATAPATNATNPLVSGAKRLSALRQKRGTVNV